MYRTEIPSLPPAETSDPVVDAYLPGIDLSLIDENLKLKPAERIAKAERFVRSLDSVRGLAQPAPENQME